MDVTIFFSGRLKERDTTAGLPIPGSRREKELLSIYGALAKRSEDCFILAVTLL